MEHNCSVYETKVRINRDAKRNSLLKFSYAWDNFIRFFNRNCMKQGLKPVHKRTVDSYEPCISFDHKVLLIWADVGWVAMTFSPFTPKLKKYILPSFQREK